MVKPILFNIEMVKAILAGRKTQTRRQINPINPNWDLKCVGEFSDGSWEFTGQIEAGSQRGSIFVKPRCQPGDILWVRESFFDCSKLHEYAIFIEKPDFLYKADNAFIGENKWKPSIHMPRKAARIFLKVTNVRVERLQDISEADAIAEGVEPKEHKYFGKGYRVYMLDEEFDFTKTAKESFIGLWISINEEKFNENPNPWVFVYEFERIER